MNLARALRLGHLSTSYHAVSLVGAGGKTTALFQLAHDFAHHSSSTVILTSTTHLGEWQISRADRHIVAGNLNDMDNILFHGVTLITGEIENDKTKPINPIILNWVREYCEGHNIPLLIEADGSHQRPLKAPAAHEPPIPEFTDTVIVVAGLTALGKPLTDEFVHRAEIFSQLSSLQIGQPITSNALIRVLTHPQGGLKNIPPDARRIVVLNQADTIELQSIGGTMAHELLDHFDSVIVGTLQHNPSTRSHRPDVLSGGQALQSFKRCAGIVLAAGESTRFGSPKQLLDWKGKPFVRQVAETALQAGLWPVEVITGFHAADVESALSGLPVSIIHNPEYHQGQSTSIVKGVSSLPEHTGSSVFLLADQPQIPIEVIRALTGLHSKEFAPIIAPLVLQEWRANPVLFDRVTFPDLLKLTGDVGGRAIFSNYKVEYVPWHDDRLLLDVDKPEDYQRLIEDETL